MDVYNRKMPGGFFVCWAICASGHALFRIPQSSISASEGRKYLKTGFKITKITKLVSMQAFSKLLSHYFFELSSKTVYTQFF